MKNQNPMNINPDNLIETLPGLCGLKDTKSIMVSANQTAAEAFGFKNRLDVEGISDYETRCPAAEFADEFVAQDKKCIENKKALIIIDIYEYAGNDLKILLSTKAPILDVNNNVQALLCQSLELNKGLLKNISQHVFPKTSSNINKKNASNTSFILGKYPEHFFTVREEECLFYLLRGKTAAGIGAKINISAKTVEKHIEKLKLKMNVHSKSQLIEAAISLGYMYIIPTALARQLIPGSYSTVF